jgi:hypothetical protein
LKRKATYVAAAADGKISVYIDDLNAADLLTYIGESKKHIKRWEFILRIILGRMINDCYKWEIVDDIRDVYAMRFDLHAGNGRIYCKQIHRSDRTTVVVACELHPSKKSDALSSKEIAIIKRVHLYEYDI